MRELREEFGVEAEVEDHIATSTHTYGHGTIELLAYRVRHVAGAFVPTEHAEIRWVRPSELSEYDFATADLPIVARLTA